MNSNRSDFCLSEAYLSSGRRDVLWLNTANGSQSYSTMLQRRRAQGSRGTEQDSDPIPLEETTEEEKSGLMGLREKWLPVLKEKQCAEGIALHGMQESFEKAVWEERSTEADSLTVACLCLHLRSKLETLQRQDQGEGGRSRLLRPHAARERACATVEGVWAKRRLHQSRWELVRRWETDLVLCSVLAQPLSCPLLHSPQASQWHPGSNIQRMRSEFSVMVPASDGRAPWTKAGKEGPWECRNRCRKPSPRTLPDLA